MIEAFQTQNNYRKIIEANLEVCLIESSLTGLQHYRGKVRDRYDLENSFALITTDRQSAFDRILATIPFKGQVLNQVGAWWFEKTKHILANHLIGTPDPNVTLAKKCTPFPIEFVVRGYITGSSSTSLWTAYEQGKREYCGVSLPEKLSKNEVLQSPVITPTTKEESHDRPISPKEIVEDGWMQKEHWEFASQKALEVFQFGQQVASEHGLILVDTKYEMGLSEEGDILLIDELHTPDSSRYWLKESYGQRFEKGLEPENIDKEFLRLWFKDHCDPYNDLTLPDAPKDLVIELSARYIHLYEVITGKAFSFPDSTQNINDRILENLAPFLPKIS